MADLAIVVVGYDRPAALARLLGSLDRVAFDGHRVPLVISLDRAKDDAVQRVAEAFPWRHGDKRVRTFPERQGLKRHVLACGDLTREYGHLIVLEDDLYVSEHLHRFTRQALDAYAGDDRIAGIALYSHLWHVGCHRPFQALDDGGDDVFFMQYACSWGQVWSPDGWSRFRAWLADRGEAVPPDPSLPDYVGQWSDHSWLKHHIRYCIETDRWFAYPRTSLCTNFSDQGTHNAGHENGYQVPLQEGGARTYRFPRLGETRAQYDAFFESRALAPVLGLAPGDLCVDLYGLKGNREGRRYWLTLAEADHAVLASFDLALRPHEANVIHGIPGTVIRLYDTARSAPEKGAGSGDLGDALVKYDVRNMSYKALLRYALRFMARRARARLTGRR